MWCVRKFVGFIFSQIHFRKCIRYSVKHMIKLATKVTRVTVLLVTTAADYTGCKKVSFITFVTFGCQNNTIFSRCCEPNHKCFCKLRAIHTR